MIEIVKIKNNEEGKYYDGYLKKNLETAKEAVKKKWDMVFVVDGIEGSGKSKFTRQCAKFLDPNFNLDNIVFTPEEFKKKVNKAGRFQAIVYDEAMSGLNSRAAMSKINKTLVQMFSTIRRKGLFIFVVLPTFFDLDKYVAIHRSRGLFHVYADDNFKRGFFMFFNIDRKKSLYLNGKKYYSYRAPPSNFKGRFTGWDPINEEEYEKRKEKALIEEQKKVKPKTTLTIQNIIRQRAILVKILNKQAHFSYKEIVKCCENHGLHVSVNILKNYLTTARKID